MLWQKLRTHGDLARAAVKFYVQWRQPLLRKQGDNPVA
jgi:hypothetical protein